MNNEKENCVNKIKKFCKLILMLLPVAFMICIIILIFKNIHDCIAWILIVCGSIVVITMIICNTIVCKCLSTRCERSNSYDDALTEMLVSHNKKCTQGNLPSITNQNLIVTVDSSTNSNITIN